MSLIKRSPLLVLKPGAIRPPISRAIAGAIQEAIQQGAIHMNGDPSFGEWLKVRRKTLDFTQAELAHQVGCAEVTLRKLEANVQRPSKQMAERLADVLQISPADQVDFVRFARGESRVAGGSARAACERWSNVQPSTNLPGPPTPLLGRGQELAALRRRLLDEGQRLVTLLGPPGVGKTRLALEAAGALAEHFADGVCWVPLAPLRDPALVPQVLCQALGLQESGLPAPERLKLYLHDKHLLLVLDNVEHLLPAAPLVAELLAACPWLHVLATSRAPLRVRAERQCPVPPLALPDPVQLSAPVDHQVLLAYAAIALFVDRAQAVQPAFELTAENAATVATLCAQLDGLPLAIELVAARVKVLPPAALLARLRGRLLLNSDGLRDVEARHQTLRKAIGWSYELLTPAEQVLLARLGVFRGGCTLAMAEAVCGVDSDPALHLDIMEGLASLVDKNLVVQKADEAGEARFVLLETILDFALERLAASGEEQAMRRRHAEVCLQLAEAAEPHLRSAEQLIWFGRLEAEQANLRAALGWCAGEGGDPLLGLQLANVLSWFWYVRAHLSEGSGWLEALLARTGEAAPASLRAWALFHNALLVMVRDGYTAARAVGEAALALAHMLGDHRLVGYLCRALSSPFCIQGEFAHAERLRAEALAAARAVGDRWLEMWALVTRLYYFNYSDPVGAITWAFEALPQVRALGDRNLLGHWLTQLANSIMFSAEPMQAAPLLAEALGLAEQIGDKRYITEAWEGLGLLAYTQNNHEEAVASYHKMIALGRQTGIPGYVARAFIHLGCLAQKQGDTLAALQHYQQALRSVKHVEYHILVANGLVDIASLAEAPDSPIDSLQATRLIGAADALYSLDDLTFEVDNAAACQQAIAAVRARLADPIHAAAWAEGQAMSLDAAMAYALALGDPVIA
jgi:predicted ATPase/DNA-binding XRE family transcriptional regulator